MAHITINPERCKACLLCIEFCPRHILVVGEAINSRGMHPVAVSDPGRCTGCRMCALMCPDLCIEVFRESHDKASATQKQDTP